MKAIISKRYIVLLAVLTVAAATVSLTSCHAGIKASATSDEPVVSASQVYNTTAPLLSFE